MSTGTTGGGSDSLNGNAVEIKPGDADLAIPLYLVQGEEVLASRKPSWLNWLRHLLAAAIIFLSSIVFFDLGALLGVLVAGLIVGYVWYVRQKATYVFTNRRIVSASISNPVLENLVGASDQQLDEIWIDDVRGMSTGTTFFESLVTAITGDSLGHVAFSSGGGVISAAIGRKFSVYDHEEIGNLLRDARARSTYDHGELVEAVRGDEFADSEGAVLGSTAE